MNPVIKFTTLFGLLAVELAERMPAEWRLIAAAVLFAAALFFVHRSFYGMRIGAGGVPHGPDAVAVGAE
jgi:K(+)-stimulated pyrophosphate-energized sodium pump